VAFAGRPVESDLSPAAWLPTALAPVPASGAVVACLVPPVFAAYARVFHPAIRYAEDDDVEVGWAAVAAANGTTGHPLMQWASVTGSLEYFENDDQAPLWHGAPARGHLPVPQAERLVDVLRRHTTTPGDCWFGVAAALGNPVAKAATLALPRGPVWLVRGPIELAAANLADEPAEQSATLWWPADRSWFVATDADLVSTYVGGSEACVAAVLAAGGLEAAPAEPRHSVTGDADRVNPPPAEALDAPRGG
jgi:hypothetical protein